MKRTDIHLYLGMQSTAEPETIPMTLMAYLMQVLPFNVALNRL